MNEAQTCSQLHIKYYNAKELTIPTHNGDFHFPLIEGEYSQPELSKADAKDANYIKKIKDKQDRQIKDKRSKEEQAAEKSIPTDLPSESNDFWTCTNEVLTRHHRTFRTKLYVPTEEESPLALKYLDILRKTSTSIKDFKYSEIADFWTSPEAGVDLQEPWQGTTVFQLLRPKAKQGHHWVYGRETRSQKSTRPGDIHPLEWPRMSSSAKKDAIESWKKEGPKRDSARATRGISQVEASDEEHYTKQLAKAIATNATPKAPAMPCMPVAMIASKANFERKFEELGTKFAQKLDKKQGKNIPSRPHQDKIAEAGHASEEYFAMVHKAVAINKAMQIPEAVKALDKEWKKLEDFLHGTPPEWKNHGRWKNEHAKQK